MEKRIKATKIEVVPSQHKPATSHRHSSPSPKSESSGGQMIGWIIGGFIILIFFVGILGSGSSSSSSSSSSSEPSLTGSMDGHAWKSASSGSKQALAADIAKRLNQGGVADVSSGFIYSALSSFYSSSDPSVLNTSISEVVGLSVAAAQ